LFDVTEQISAGNHLIAGIMLESFLNEGNQPVNAPEKLEYGVSVTDKCIGWQETEELIRHLAETL
jgi:3-deoxy-7-phosphoheptulonate synthase